ncbi:plasmid replication protein, CyRepA1 family [Phormidesmis sp. 146-35]
MVSSLRSAPVGTIDLNPIFLPNLAASHEQEWLDSGVDPEIIRLNVKTLHDTAIDPFTHEVSYPIAEHLNWAVTRFGQQSRANVRGWWVSGIDPFAEWQRMDWGRFKPDGETPVFDRAKQKPAKYLSPSLGKGSSRLVLLDVPGHVWRKVADRFGCRVSGVGCRVSGVGGEEAPGSFWRWVWENNIPIVLTEGEKKAGCLLSQGFAAIALPGIFSGYRRDTRQLIAELAHFATEGRSVHICFDYETKPKTIQNIVLATARLGQLLTRSGCEVNVISLPGPQKGVDDFVVAAGSRAFEDVYTAAASLEVWQASRLWSLTYAPTIVLDQPYLRDLPYPTSGLVGVKSAKGTGKTTALQKLIRGAIAQGRKVLVITHRIQLGKAICQGLGIDWIEELPESETQGQFGYGLCIDSLHPHSKARFNPEDWEGAIVILDEVEQVLWHALNSATCYKQRVKILETLQELAQVVFSTGGLLIAQDADLSDVSIDYLKGLADDAIAPWIVVNQWQAEQGWNVSLYDTKNAAPLMTRMEDVIETGAVFVCLDSQKVKGKWSSKNLETYLQSRFPNKRILRIDSESVADPDHAAYRIVDRLNEILPSYDIVLSTPTIGTGVSIDIRGHFKAVFGIFQGVTPDSESRQALARVRESVPRYVWAAYFSPSKIGNGSCHYREVAQSMTKAVKYNISLLKDVDFDLDEQSDPISLRTWAKMAARVNASLWSYRKELRNGLLMEGHQVTVVTDDVAKLFGQTFVTGEMLRSLADGSLQISGFEFLGWRHDAEGTDRVIQSIAQIRTQNQKAEAIAISASPELSAAEYDELKDQSTQTTRKRHSKRKHELQRRYPIEITPELKLKDDEGWYSQLRLHYYLSYDPEFVKLHDMQELQGHLDRGDGKISVQDLRLLTAQVEALRSLKILDFLRPDEKIRASDSEVQHVVSFATQYKEDIKTLFNITITEKLAPMAIVQALLGKIGLKLTCTGRDQAADGRRGGVRVYKYYPPTDDRETIFAEWEKRDISTLQTLMEVTGCDSFSEMDDWMQLSA